MSIQQTKIVFIGCKPFKGTDRCGFQYSFYEENLKIGDIFNTIPDGSMNYDYVLIFYKNFLYPQKKGVILSFPRKYFVTLQEWCEMKINKILE